MPIAWMLIFQHRLMKKRKSVPAKKPNITTVVSSGAYTATNTTVPMRYDAEATSSGWFLSVYRYDRLGVKFSDATTLLRRPTRNQDTCQNKAIYSLSP